MKQLYLLLITSLLILGCVTNKQVQYLQKGDVNEKKVITDDIVRTYIKPSFEYEIQPDDILSINVESLTDTKYNIFDRGSANVNPNINEQSASLSGHLVDQQGNVEFPVIGKVHVAGKTLEQIQDTLKQITSQFIRDPVVRVRLLNFRFTVLGEVGQEGTITTYNNAVSILEAISLAGGLTDLADRSKIKLIRQTGESNEVFYINLLKEEFMESDNFYIMQKDLIIVPPLRIRTFRTNFGPNLSLVLSGLTTILLAINLFRN